MTDKPTEESMARDLIDHIKRTHTPRLALLEDRIAAAIDYMSKVTAPNRVTLDHVRWYLDGSYDGTIAHQVADRIENGS